MKFEVSSILHLALLKTKTLYMVLQGSVAAHPETTHPKSPHPKYFHPKAAHPKSVHPESVHPENYSSHLQ